MRQQPAQRQGLNLPRDRTQHTFSRSSGRTQGLHQHTRPEEPIQTQDLLVFCGMNGNGAAQVPLWRLQRAKRTPRGRDEARLYPLQCPEGAPRQRSAEAPHRPSEVPPPEPPEEAADAAQGRAGDTRDSPRPAHGAAAARQPWIHLSWDGTAAAHPPRPPGPAPGPPQRGRAAVTGRGNARSPWAAAIPPPARSSRP